MWHAQNFKQIIPVCTRITEPTQNLILDSLEFKISQNFYGCSHITHITTDTKNKTLETFLASSGEVYM